MHKRRYWIWHDFRLFTADTNAKYVFNSKELRYRVFAAQRNVYWNSLVSQMKQKNLEKFILLFVAEFLFASSGLITHKFWTSSGAWVRDFCKPEISRKYPDCNEREERANCGRQTRPVVLCEESWEKLKTASVLNGTVEIKGAYMCGSTGTRDCEGRKYQW